MNMTTVGTVTKQREIILVPFPFSDLSTSKKRPAFVLTPSHHNIMNQDLVVN